MRSLSNTEARFLVPYWGFKVLKFTAEGCHTVQPWMKELKGIIHGGEGAFLRCPVSNSVQFSLRNEGSTEYMCVRGEINGDNIYRCQSACPEGYGYNDFDFLKEAK